MRLVTGYGEGKREIWHALELSDDERRRLHGVGKYEIAPQIEVASRQKVTFEFQIGEMPVETEGRLCVAWRWPFDWSNLQNESPEEPGYFRIEYTQHGPATSPEVVLEGKYDVYGGIEPFHHNVQIKVAQGELQPGDIVRLTCGEDPHGQATWQAPTCACKQVEFLLLIDHRGTPRWTELLGKQKFAVVPGPAQRLVAVAPSQAAVGEELEVLVRVEDTWGNATWTDKAPELSAAGCEPQNPSARRAPEAPGYWYTTSPQSPGILHFTASLPGTDLQATSNPLCVTAAPPAERIFWGDLHSGQSFIGCGAGTLAEHYAYGRDAAGIQFLTHQANDHYVTIEDWEETRRETEAYHEPGKYVPILGCEWSPPTRDGGDRNVFYNYDEPSMWRSARFFTAEPSPPEPDIPTAPEFHKTYADKDILVNLHVGGRPTNLEWFDQRTEKLCEIHSTHGTSPWMIEEALERGYRVAVTAGTDGVMGRPGACHPGIRLIRNVRSGLTAVVAPELTRASLWNALQNRRCYATTGSRTILDVAVAGEPMGSEVSVDGPVEIRLHVIGSAPIERVDFLRGTHVVGSWQAPWNPDESLLRVLWGGTGRRGTARLQKLIWNGDFMLEGAEIESIEPIGFQSPQDTCEIVRPYAVTFRSATAGNDMGLLLRGEFPIHQTGRFSSEPATFDFRREQTLSAPLVFDAGEVGRHVTIGPMPNGPTELSLSFTDHQPFGNSSEAGVTPYWVRVTQTDRHKAWSSPVYVTRKK